jgi:hypothetical protein
MAHGVGHKRTQGCRLEGRPGVLLALALGLALPAVAQRPPARDLSWLALQWARGDFRAPLICEIDHVPRRGLRRVLIAPGPRQVEPPVNRLRLFDLEVPKGTRCMTEMKADLPNAIGTVAFLHRGLSRPDTAERDFAATLRREGGFEYEIVSGRLQIGAAGQPESMREVDFAGGRMWLREIARGSDAQRRLAEFGAQRKLQLAIEAPGGTRLEFDLVQFDER